MTSWKEICDLFERYSNKSSEIDYQKSIIDLILRSSLGWSMNQINEQMRMHLGSTERLIPDVVVEKDGRNKFVIEVKHPSHIRCTKNIDQLVSYMKQLETPIGIYMGKELEVYYKKIGDGSDPKLIMTLHFNANDENGDSFISLFAEPNFSIENLTAIVR